ncbi:MAG: hypothetical protein HFG05_01185 [Oscillibacter sp.]|nr:hypothetical protein [Oscillibacter sp.]
MRRKVKDNSGLTLVETLCAVLILVLLSLMLNSGLSMAIKTYQGITAESETQLLLSSLSDALADKLRYCVVYVDDAGDYRSSSIGEVQAAGGKIVVYEPDTGEEKPLLPDGAYGNPDGFYKGNYQVTMGSAAPGGADSATLKETYQKDTNSFAVKLTVKDVHLNITKTRELTVRCLNPPKEAAETPPGGETP